jgi:hypothetical protein
MLIETNFGMAIAIRNVPVMFGLYLDVLTTMRAGARSTATA